MTNAATIQPLDLTPLRRDPAARGIVRSWRRLTCGDGGDTAAGRTLVACSAGADSTALLLALAGESDQIVASYVRHAMRSRGETDVDLARVRDLAAALGVPFAAAEAPGASEAEARRSRYAALADLAGRHACPFVAVGHHADDLLETQIMALLRGASPRGLASLRPRRRLAEYVTLIRPMLGVRREDTERLCALAGVAPIEDRTNAETDRLRAALRVGVLGDVAPRAALRARRTAALMRQAQGLVEERAAAVRRAARTGADECYPRALLAAEPGIVIAEVLRRAFAERTGGRGMDAMTGRTLRPIVRAIRDDSNERRGFRLAMGVRVVVEGDAVRMEKSNEA